MDYFHFLTASFWYCDTILLADFAAPVPSPPVFSDRDQGNCTHHYHIPDISARDATDFPEV